MDPLRVYLLAGLVAHKLIWEIWKRRGVRSETVGAISLKAVAAKAAKLVILAVIVAQTLLPDIWPLASDPGLLRAVGAVLFTGGLLLAITARIQLGGSWADIEAEGVRPSQALVSRGIYRYLRHPIYTGDLLLLLGLELAVNSWLVVGVVPLAAVVVYQALREERLLAAALPGYEDYCRRTKRFIPLVW
ncbi:MAG: isoprenylcysteine carboxylmethyltransferase family protein [Bryobacterales bacterium]|nr:isoprenylcysteine carboxylmethyltransferase family protein [Bryobacteraceae bacterium]MDW8355893.1 isoprenylcysteine carboxylmethyltransferase family protein [Bryobacterales bacterium]